VLIWRSVAIVQLAGKSRITKINELGLERIMAAFVAGRLAWLFWHRFCHEERPTPTAWGGCANFVRPESQYEARASF
jgi:hypothetical protein